MAKIYFSPRIRIIFFIFFAAFCSSAWGNPNDYFTIPEIKLLSNEYSGTSWGGTAKQMDAADDEVLFVFSGLSDSSTGLKDNYPVDTVYGQILPSHGSGDFSNFDGYMLWVKNLDAGSVSFSLFINTGFTGPSGNPSNDLRNDTFWQSEWTEIPPGEARTLWLDFDNAIPWNISNNPFPHTQGTDGMAAAINAYDRAEISAVGFQLYAHENPEAAVLVASAAGPLCGVQPEADLNNDCKVDFGDLAVMASHWLDCNLTPASLCE